MHHNNRPTRVMVAGDDALQARQVADLLNQQGCPVASGLLVPLSRAADQASRTNPDLLVLLLGDDSDGAVAAVRQTRNSCSAYVLAIGPADDPQRILRSLHEGADEYLDSSKFLQELASALTRFALKRHGRGGDASSGKVISLLGASGGVGASTIAINVAGLLARKHHSAGLIDLCLEAGDLAALLNLAPQHTLADFCNNAGRIDRNVFDQMFTPHASGMQLMAAPWDPNQAGLVTSQSLRLLLAMGRAKFPYLVLDLESRLSELTLEALWQSDVILLVTRLDFVSVRNARRLLDRLLEIGLERDRMRVVANRYGQPRELGRAQAEAALGTSISHFVAEDAGRVHRSANEGRVIAIQSRWSRISRNLNQLAFAVNGKPA